MNPNLHALWSPAGALLIGLAAALSSSALNVPLPWMIGPLLAVAAVRMCGVHVTGPRGGRQTGQWIIGSALGLYFTPAVVEHLGTVAWLLVVGALFAIGLGYVCGYVLSLLAGTDRTTALFSSVPGGAAEMTILGERFGARVDEVAAAQSLRILIVVVSIPSIYAALRLHGADPFVAGDTEVRWPVLATLLAATAVGGFVMQKLKAPNAFVLGALAVAIPLTALAFTASAVPRWLINLAQLLLGCALGSRFNRSFLTRAPRFVGCRRLDRGPGDDPFRALCHRARPHDGSSPGDARARDSAGGRGRDGRYRQGSGAGRAAGDILPRDANRVVAALHRTAVRVVGATQKAVAHIV